jgi:GMP synthase-like glutamine amidotransferase
MIVFGGGYRIDENHSWMTEELRAIEEAIEGGPLLGICLGAQMICHLLGGSLQRAPRGEYGFHRLQRSGRDPLLDGLQRSPLFYSFHEDRMILPSQTRTFLRSDISPQGVRFRKNVVGLQFHPEMTMPLLLWRNRHLPFLLKEAGLSRREQDLRVILGAPRQAGQHILRNWAKEARCQLA